MKIIYDNPKVENCFTDFSVMKRKLNPEWVKPIKKHINNLEAADNFGIFLSLRLGKPEPLSGYKFPTYSLHISANVRLIIELQSTENENEDEVKNCECLIVKGVCDYHGSKENWYIP